MFKCILFYVYDVLPLQVSLVLDLVSQSHIFKDDYLEARDKISVNMSSRKPSVVIKGLKYFIILKLQSINFNSSGKSFVSLKVYALENVYTEIIYHYGFIGDKFNPSEHKPTIDKAHVVSSHTTNLSYTVLVNKEDTSWTKASYICQKFGGQLPSIRSLPELKAIVALILDSYQAERRFDYLKWFRAVFVGHKAEVSNVCNILFLFWFLLWLANFCLLQLESRWTTGDPVAFQMWSGLNNITYSNVVLHSWSMFGHHERFNNSKLQTCLLPQNCKRCTALLVENLANPYWVSVGCHEKLLRDIICVNSSTHMWGNAKYQNSGLSECAKGSILKNRTCYRYQWVYKTLQHLAHCVLNLEFIYEIFHAARCTKWPPFISSTNRRCTFERCFDTLCGTNNFMSCTDTSPGGFCIQRQHMVSPPINLNLFLCASGTLTIATNVCDGNTDCIKDSDEKICQCNPVNTHNITSNKLKNGKLGI